MESINKLMELSAVYRDLADKFMELNKELVMGNAKAAQRVKGLIDENKKIAGELQEAIKEIDHQLREKNKRTRELEIRTRELEEAQRQNAEMDLFIAILAHDLRNPFNALLNLSELMAENVYHKPIDDIAFQARIINESAQTANSLLNGILMWVRNKAGAVPFNPQVTSLCDICMETLKTLYPMALAKQIEVECTSEDEVTADHDMIQAIFRNLITNAIKYTPPEGRIKIYSEQRDNDVVVTVADNGIGIDPGRLDTLFDISKMRSTPGTEKEKGTGLGLIICKQFVEMHGGRLWVESESGKGTSFHFSIPVKNNQLNQPKEKVSSQPHASRLT